MRFIKNLRNPTIRIFLARIVNKIKFNNNSPYEKSRIVVQGFQDAGKKEILTQSPTI